MTRAHNSEVSYIYPYIQSSDRTEIHTSFDPVTERVRNIDTPLAKLWCLRKQTQGDIWETDMSKLSYDDTDLQLDLQPILHANLHSDLHTDLQADLQTNLHAILQEIYKQICRQCNICESKTIHNFFFHRSSSTSDLSIHKWTQWLILLESIRDQF